MMLGLSPEALRRVVYVRPTGHPTPEKWEAVRVTAHGLSDRVVGDRLGERGAYRDGVNGNSTEDVTAWHKAFVEPLMGTTECSVLLVDHVPAAPKNGRASTPIGSQAKRAMITGSSFRVDVVTPLRPGHVGVLDLYVSKDRPGAVRKVSLPVQPDKTQHAARIRFDATDEFAIRTFIDPPPSAPANTIAEKRDRTSIDDAIKERISRAAELSSVPLSANALATAVGGNRNTVLALINRMTDDRKHLREARPPQLQPPHPGRAVPSGAGSMSFHLPPADETRVVSGIPLPEGEGRGYR